MKKTVAIAITFVTACTLSACTLKAVKLDKGAIKPNQVQSIKGSNATAKLGLF